MQKRVKIKLIPERQGGHLHAEEVEEKIPRERQGGHLQAELLGGKHFGIFRGPQNILVGP